MYKPKTTPVKYTGKTHARLYNFLRHTKYHKQNLCLYTTNENVEYNGIEYDVPKIRKKSIPPDPWDDILRDVNHSWKKHRKKQYKNENSRKNYP